ncbi:MAG: indolepyruvate oxidoreductase subunit beta [Anaerotignum sp.]
MVKNVLLVGVGGQGTILAAKLLTQGLMEAGYDVKMSEIHGMSQRGGSVSSHVRYGEKVESTTINPGEADLLVSFEKMEALRELQYLKPNGMVVVNTHEMPSMPILTGDADYPVAAIEEIQKYAKTIVLDATKMAMDMGNAKVANIILLGTIIKSMGLENIDWETIVRKNVKPAFIDMNIEAMRRGMDAIV